MNTFNKWEHLILKGEYAERKKLLSGLTAEEVNKKPVPGMHSIYEELWHTERWQHIVIDNDRELDKKWQQDLSEIFPKTDATQEEWNRLVTDFLSGLDKMMKITANREELLKVDEQGITIEDNVYSLIIHNSYHLGKIVAIRQMLGAWSSKEIK
jgi:uncharacterized damage-inducible protein DinB